MKKFYTVSKNKMGAENGWLMILALLRQIEESRENQWQYIDCNIINYLIVQTDDQTGIQRVELMSA